MDDRQKLKLYKMFMDQGVVCLCTHCGEKNYCACDVRTLEAECFHCAVKRIEREEGQKARLEKFNYEDFIKL